MRAIGLDSTDSRRKDSGVMPSVLYIVSTRGSVAKNLGSCGDMHRCLRDSSTGRAPICIGHIALSNSYRHMSKHISDSESLNLWHICRRWRGKRCSKADHGACKRRNCFFRIAYIVAFPGHRCHHHTTGRGLARRSTPPPCSRST